MTYTLATIGHRTTFNTEQNSYNKVLIWSLFPQILPLSTDMLRAILVWCQNGTCEIFLTKWLLKRDNIEDCIYTDPVKFSCRIVSLISCYRSQIFVNYRFTCIQASFCGSDQSMKWFLVGESFLLHFSRRFFSNEYISWSQHTTT